ncbi:putative nicotinate-nucleotide adenylyltransferase [Gammaproteobacteria bacterium]
MQTLPIGIFGGTFDPIHLGHTHLANTMQKLCYLQKILLIPCFQSPLRNPPIASAKDRLNMVKLAINDPTHFFADDREIKHADLSYTIETIRSLRLEYADTPLALIMSIDAFNRFDEWHEWQSILEATHLLIANRPGSWQITNPKMMELLHKHQIIDTEQLQKQTAGLIYLANINPLPITATQIRALIKKHKSANHLVAPGVWQYICKKQLYT